MSEKGASDVSVRAGGEHVYVSKLLAIVADDELPVADGLLQRAVVGRPSSPATRPVADAHDHRRRLAGLGASTC